MDWSILQIGGYPLRVSQTGTVVVGSGAAGFNAADQLWKFGCKDVALVTEGVMRGTSRNTGSDKQTYYKLTLSGGEPDSVGEMARTLFDGRCVDGDIALAEAANSAPAFLRLCELGVLHIALRVEELLVADLGVEPVEVGLLCDIVLIRCHLDGLLL